MTDKDIVSYDGMMKSIYTCGNCGHNQDTDYINAMMAAGFGLGHLPCKECGQHTINEERE